jgi:hypothetical protein
MCSNVQRVNACSTERVVTRNREQDPGEVVSLIGGLGIGWACGHEDGTVHAVMDHTDQRRPYALVPSRDGIGLRSVDRGKRRREVLDAVAGFVPELVAEDRRPRSDGNRAPFVRAGGYSRREPNWHDSSMRSATSSTKSTRPGRSPRGRPEPGAQHGHRGRTASQGARVPIAPCRRVVLGTIPGTNAAPEPANPLTCGGSPTCGEVC